MFFNQCNAVGMENIKTPINLFNVTYAKLGVDRITLSSR